MAENGYRTENDYIAEYVKEKYPNLISSFNYSFWKVGRTFTVMINELYSALSGTLKKIKAPEIDLDKVAKEKQEKQEKQTEELDKWAKLWIYLNDWRMGVAPDESTPEEDRQWRKAVADTLSDVMDYMVEFENEEEDDGMEKTSE